MPVAPSTPIKRAQAQMTEEDLRAFRDIVTQQKENARRRELRQRNRFDRNRSQRVADAKSVLMLLLGFGGFAGGATLGRAIPSSVAGKAIGSLAGGFGLGAAGLIGGNYLGKVVGNRKADDMEQIERDTGIRVDEQDAASKNTQARNTMLYSMLSNKGAV